jgi:fumarate reductase subunit C
MPGSTQYSPKTFRARVSTYWWLDHWPYLRFILRELSSVFVAWFVVITVLQIRALRRGPDAYEGFQQWLRSPILVVANVVTLLFVIFHAATWFNLTPKAMPLRVGGKRVPILLIVGPSYLVWLAISAAVAWILLRG